MSQLLLGTERPPAVDVARMVMESAARHPIRHARRSDHMELVAIVIVLALLQFIVFGMLVGRARGTLRRERRRP